MLAVATGRRIVGDVHVGRSEEILQRYEETWLQAAAETDTETAGSFRFGNVFFQRQTLLMIPVESDDFGDQPVALPT